MRHLFDAVLSRLRMRRSSSLSAEITPSSIKECNSIMSRRRRRNLKTKETLSPSKTKGLNKKLKSTKKIQHRKKKVLLKTTAKSKTNFKKVKEIKKEPVEETVPADIIQVPEKIPFVEEEQHNEPPAIAAEEIISNSKDCLNIEDEASCDSEDGAMQIVISDVEEEIEIPFEDESKQQDANIVISELKNQNTVDENHNESETVSVLREEEDMMGDSNTLCAPYICTICNITTDSSASLTNHMRQHSITNNQTHQCLICSKSLSSASSLDRHMLVHSGERPFRCKLCDMSFTTNGNMHRHMRTHGEIDTLENGKTLDLRKREAAKTDVPKEPENLLNIVEAKLHCPVCGKGFLCKNGLQTHMETHPNDPILCQKCDVISVNYNAHVDHKCDTLASKSPGKCQHGLKCGFQDLTFMDFTASKFSLVSKTYCEQNVKRPTSAFHAFECKECKKAFPCGRALKLHQQVHDSEVGTFCPSCQCDFAAASFLQLHQLKHRSAEHCLNNSFQSSEMAHELKLSQNHAPHAGKEDFLALLNLQTKQSQLSLFKNLKSSHIPEDNFENMDYFVHAKVMRKDSNEIDGGTNNNNNNDFADIQSIISLTSKAPLISAAQTSPIAVCPASPLPFASSHHPKSPPIAESASASPETPSKDEMIAVDQDVPDDESSVDVNGIYSCKICSQKFRNSSALKRHSKLHVQRGSNYSCHICSYVSVDKSTLIRHLRTHNGERPFQCVICKYAFTTKANCERHVRKRHKKFGKNEIRNSMQYNPNMSHRSVADPTTPDISNSETVCKYCGVDFKFNRVLRHHLRSLHNSCNRKPFSCKICKFGFSTKNNCIRHVLKQHPNLKDKLRSVVIPNSQMQQTVNTELTSSTDNSNSSTTNQPIVEQVQPLDLHCNATDAPLDLQAEKPMSEFNANEAVMAAEGLVSLSEAPPLQEEPLDLAAHALDLSCKPLAAVTKKPESKPTSIYNAPPPCIYKPVGFIDLSVAKSPPVPVPDNKIQISPLPMNNCSKKLEIVNKNDTTANTPGQKQRSFTCVYCCAGFTLKSNMERHIKRKHPEFARPTRSRNFIPSMVTPNLQKPNSATLSDKTRDALRHVLSTKVQQVPVYKSFNSETFPKIGSTFKIVGSAHSFITPVSQIPGHKAILNLSLDLSGKTEKVAIVDINNTNILKPVENGNDEPCSDLASVSSVICTANSPQFKQYLGKSSDIEKMEVTELEEKADVPEDSDSGKKGEVPSVSCPFCERKFPWTSSLRRHILTHTGQKPYKCPKCSLWFTTKSNCERHLIRKHGHKGDLITRSVPDRPYKCNHCLTSTFSTQGNLRKHFYLKHWTKSYLGMNCKPIQMDKKGTETSESEALLEEAANPPPVRKAEIAASVTSQEHSYSQPERKLVFACSFCESSFENIVNLKNHMSKHNSVIYMCYLCRKTFSTNEECYNHFKTSHSLVYLQLNPAESSGMSAAEDDEEESPEADTVDKSGSPVACMVCFQKMSSVEKLQMHFKKHLKDKQTDNPEPVTLKENNVPATETLLNNCKPEPSNSAKKPRLTKGKVKNSLLYLFTQTPGTSPIRSPKTVNSKLDIVSPEEDSDLIQNLLGIHDSKMIDEMLVSADSAARLLGVKEM